MNTQVAIAKVITAIEEDIRHPQAMEGVVRKMPRPTGTSVYTAFDGDHFCLTSAMAQHATHRGHIAINPEACLGYKEAVDSLQIKKNVLYYDVSLLSKADEVWVYTPWGSGRPAWHDLPEGVAIEIAWYALLCRKARQAPRISFVDVHKLALGLDPDPKPICISATALEDELRVTVPEAYAVAGGFEQIGSAPVAVPIFALQDAKNGPWVRQWVITEGCAPIVPTIAFEPTGSGALQRLAEGWVWALRHADRVVQFAQMNGRSSTLLATLEGLCHSYGIETELVSWSRVQAPKAIQGLEWPITLLEREEMVRASLASGAANPSAKGERA